MADENLNGLDGIISRLMSDPGIMETVRSAVSEMKLTGEGGDAPKKTDTAPQQGAPDMQSIAALASMLGGTGGGRGSKPPGGDSNRKKRCDLLNALKPYRDHRLHAGDRASRRRAEKHCEEVLTVPSNAQRREIKCMQKTVTDGYPPV